MLTSLYAAASGMEAAEALHASTAANLAQAHLSGFRRSLSVDAFGGDADRVQRPPGAGGLASEPIVDFSPGRLEQTDQPLDLALDGPGFFAVDGPDGPLYSRNGVFQLGADGVVTTTGGLSLQGVGGRLTLPGNASLQQLQIASDGSIRVGNQTVGRIRIVNFEDVSRLERMRATLFRAPDDQPPQPSEASVLQGVRELSNVQPVTELVSLITASRRYEAAQRAMHAVSEATQKMIDRR